MPPPKVYAVARGRTVGILPTWDACRAAITGFSGATFRSFSSQSEARAWLSMVSGGAAAASSGASAAEEGGAPPPAAAAAGPPLLRLGPRGFVARFDGACLGNPGPGGAGALLYGLPPPHSSGARDYNVGHGTGVAQGWEVLWSGAEHVGGGTTNNVAEYTGLLLALKAALRLGVGGGAALLVQGDSELVIRQVLGEYQVRAPHLLLLHAEVLRALARLRERRVEVRFRHILREKNVEADALSNVGVAGGGGGGGGGEGGGGGGEKWAPGAPAYTAPPALLKRFGLGHAAAEAPALAVVAAAAAAAAAASGGGAAAAKTSGAKRPREDDEEEVVELLESDLE
jgi:ribonuclease HI